MIIGDGQGFLGVLIKRMMPHARLSCVDLPKMLIWQATLHQRAGTAAVFLTPDDLGQVPASIDTAINVSSMQEMTHESIARYFAFLRQNGSARFYCMNRVEKILPDGTAIRFQEYPWKASDPVYVDGPCLYCTHFLQPRPPFWSRFDGPMWHRLVSFRTR